MDPDSGSQALTYKIQLHPNARQHISTLPTTTCASRFPSSSAYRQPSRRPTLCPRLPGCHTLLPQHRQPQPERFLRRRRAHEHRALLRVRTSPPLHELNFELTCKQIQRRDQLLLRRELSCLIPRPCRADVVIVSFCAAVLTTVTGSLLTPGNSCLVFLSTC
jgi:hypothetical protein